MNVKEELKKRKVLGRNDRGNDVFRYGLTLLGCAVISLGCWSVLVKAPAFFMSKPELTTWGCEFVGCDSPQEFRDNLNLIYHEGFIAAYALTFTFLLAAVGLWKYTKDRRSARNQDNARFLADMSNSYIENQDFTKIYQILDAIYFDEMYKKAKTAAGEAAEKEAEKEAEPIRVIDYDVAQKARKDLDEMIKSNFATISNYFSFFEVFAILLRTGAVELAHLNDLFYYRFFLAAKNVKLREITLGIEKEEETEENGETVGPVKSLRADYYRNIADLEEKWTIWRKKNNLKVIKYYGRDKNAPQGDGAAVPQGGDEDARLKEEVANAPGAAVPQGGDEDAP